MADTIFIDGHKLRLLREKLALSQEGLEYACSQQKGCSVSIATIKRAELGKSLSKRTVARLAKFFSVPLEELIKTTSLASEKENFKQRLALTLWVQIDSKIILNEIRIRIDQLSPLTTEHFGNTLVAALPCIDDEKKLYLTLQQFLLKLSHQATQHFTAIISTQLLSNQDEGHWHLDEAYIHEMSDFALQLDDATILVSDLLIEASAQYFSYCDQALIPGYKMLIKGGQASFGETQGRHHEIDLFQYVIDGAMRKNEHCLLAIQGVQGIGKSHMLNVLANLAEKQGWQTVRLDFHLALAPEALLLNALKDLLPDNGESQTDKDNDFSNTGTISLAKAIGRIGPVFLSLDNFHLIDETTLATLLKMITQSESKSLVIGAAYLPTNAANQHVDAFSTVRMPVFNMTLQPLEYDDMVQLPASDVTSDMMALSLDGAKGNPAHYYHLLMLYAHNKIPFEVTLYLESKIDALPAELSRVMSFIALVTDHLTLTELCAAATPQSGVIDKLIEMRLIRLSPEQVVYVNHPFLTHVLQQKISHQEKRKVYLCMANYLASGASKPTQETQRQMIDYYTKAEAWQKVAQALLMVGRQYIEKGEYAAAKKDLHTALECYKRQPATEQQLDLLFEIYLLQAIIERQTKGWVSHSTVAAYQRCIVLAKQMGCPFRHCISLSGLWVRQLMAMDFELSENTANEMLSLAEQSQNDRCKSLAHSCLSNSQFWLAKHQDAIRNAKASFQYFQHIEDQNVYLAVGINPLALAGCFGGLSSILTCRDEDVQFFQNPQFETLTQNDPFSYAIVLQGKIWSAYHLKDFDNIVILAEQLLEIADWNNFPFYRGIALLFKGWALSFVDTAPNEELSLTLVEEGYSHWLASSGDQIAHSLYSLIKAEVYCRFGCFDEAKRILEKGIELALQKKEVCYLSPMYALMGGLADNDGADYINMSQKIADEQGAHLFMKQSR
ncbi:XRE family transcriptional regulator [Vibrio spartinae]|uniref:ATPase n=1 Tax=Vibrio spartinae TaxID=1918945 RepID=A0ABX6QXF6_9VIBR|nr:XRE family transcriptional regulator [Vibrio spartinae]QMV13923.1 putative ATPase [Vibrio spartinae]